jgi:hypothetical protein
MGIPLAGLLLIGGATAVLAQSGAATGAATAVVNAATGAGSVLADVLGDLVTDGTINQSQADAITEAVDTRRTELREQAQALREQMRTFLEDGVLSAEELAKLPADHPLRNLDQYLEDGQLTADELRQLRGFGFGHGRGHHGQPWGAGRDRDGDTDTNTNPAASPDAGSSSFSID